MKDLVANYDRSVTEKRNFGRTEADLIAQLIQDRDDIRVHLQLTEKELYQERESHKKKVEELIHRSHESEVTLRMIWNRLDSIIDDGPYQNRTKKETQEMISKLMDDIRDYLQEE